MKIECFIKKATNLPHATVKEDLSRCLRLSAQVFIRILLCVFYVAFSYHMQASPVDMGKARQAVSNWIAKEPQPLGLSIGSKVLRSETQYDVTGAPLYHIVYLTENGISPAGLVLVAGDDEIEPIVAFCNGEHFDPTDHSPLSNLVKADLAGRLNRARQIKASGVISSSSPSVTQQKWNRLLNPTYMSSPVATPSDIRVKPLVASRWSQWNLKENPNGPACYNYFTPPYGAGNANNYVCGCVATAMAQLLRFHQYPNTGVGTSEFVVYVDGVAQYRNLRGGDGNGGPYSWAKMVLAPNSTTTVAQRQAIGALTADAGTSVNMEYTSDESGAYGSACASALVNTFQYSNAVLGADYDFGFRSNLLPMINPNLDAGYPVLLGILGEPGGHEIVCDGYGYNLSTLYHHLNMGWAGQDDAWYALPVIDTVVGAFSVIDECTYNVYVSGGGEIVSGRVTDSYGKPLSGVAISASRTGGGSYTATTNAKGIYALTKLPSGSTFNVQASLAGRNFGTRSVTTGSSREYSNESGNQWQIDFSDNGAPVYSISTASSPIYGGATIGCGVYQAGSTVVLSASAGKGFAFVNWSEGGVSVSGSQNYSFVVNGNRSLVANFIPNGSSNNTVFATGFNSSEGYSSALPLAGQMGWVQMASGGNGILNGAFSGLGQQAYVGYFAPDSGDEFTALWRPVDHVPAIGEKITFSTLMSVVDSDNHYYDEFLWIVYNKAGYALAGLIFDNYTLSIASTSGDTGFYFVNGKIYVVQMTLDFGKKRWSATLNGNPIVINKPFVTTTGMTLGEVAAWWYLNDPVNPGNNFMVFDQYNVQKLNGTSYSVSANASPSCGGATSGAGSYPKGTTAFVSATPQAGYAFQSWTENGIVVSKSATFSFPAGRSRALVSKFKKL
jgi:hypothetical protein